MEQMRSEIPAFQGEEQDILRAILKREIVDRLNTYMGKEKNPLYKGCNPIYLDNALIDYQEEILRMMIDLSEGKIRIRDFVLKMFDFLRKVQKDPKNSMLHARFQQEFEDVKEDINKIARRVRELVRNPEIAADEDKELVNKIDEVRDMLAGLEPITPKFQEWLDYRGFAGLQREVLTILMQRRRGHGLSGAEIFRLSGKFEPNKIVYATIKRLINFTRGDVFEVRRSKPGRGGRFTIVENDPKTEKKVKKRLVPRPLTCEPLESTREVRKEVIAWAESLTDVSEKQRAIALVFAEFPLSRKIKINEIHRKVWSNAECKARVTTVDPYIGIIRRAQNYGKPFIIASTRVDGDLCINDKEYWLMRAGDSV